MNVVFMGTPKFALVSLNKLLDAKINISAVVTVPDKPKGRGLNVQASPIKIEAQRYKIPVLQPEKLNNENFVNELIKYKPDLIVVVAFRILPEIIFELPPLGTVNLHGSLLPKYRGAAPINWAIINGEKETGVTTFFIKKQVDTGNIIQTCTIPIGENMTAGELHDVMAEKGAEILVETCLSIQAGNVQAKLQENSEATKAPKIFKQDCLINFNTPAINVHNFIRGLSPYPAAFSYFNKKIIKFFISGVDSKEEKSQLSPGAVVRSEKKYLTIQCNPGIINISELQLEGKRRMKVEEFLNGFNVHKGFKFG